MNLIHNLTLTAEERPESIAIRLDDHALTFAGWIWPASWSLDCSPSAALAPASRPR